MTYTSDVAIYPGLKIQEIIDHLWIKQKEFADRMDVSEKTLSLLLNWKISLTYETAEKLEYVTWVKQSFWNKLEAAFQEDKLRLSKLERLVNQENHAWKFTCYKELVKLSLVKDTRKRNEKTDSLCQFLRITSLDSFYSKSNLSEVMAFRKSNSNKLSKENLACWLMAWNMLIDRADQKENIQEYSPLKIKSIIWELKKLTLDLNNLPKQKITSLLNSCGIYFIVLNHFDKVPVNWVSKMYNGQPCIQMSTRQSRLDVFWFTLFHELGHIYNWDLTKENIILDLDSNIQNKKEMMADIFAQENLIDPKLYWKMIEKDNLWEIDFKNLAKKLWIWINIVMWRITHDLKTKQEDIYQLTSKYRPTLKSIM
jgi:HTH-type transcriptional regulator/antitoxin HigA